MHGREGAGNVIEKGLDATRSLATAMYHDLPVLKKRYLELVCALTDTAQKAQRKSVGTCSSNLCRRRISKSCSRKNVLEPLIPS